MDDSCLELERPLPLHLSPPKAQELLLSSHRPGPDPINNRRGITNKRIFQPRTSCQGNFLP